MPAYKQKTSGSNPGRIFRGQIVQQLTSRLPLLVTSKTGTILGTPNNHRQ